MSYYHHRAVVTSTLCSSKTLLQALISAVSLPQTKSDGLYACPAKHDTALASGNRYPNTGGTLTKGKISLKAS